MVNPPNPTTTEHGEHSTPVDPGNPPTPRGSISSYVASATNSDTNQPIDMATAMSQYIEENSAVRSFGPVERISEKLVPLRARRERPIMSVRYFLWIRDQRERAAVSTEGACSNAREAHENPWKPCQPSNDAKEWNGIEGIDGAPPAVDVNCPTTPSVTDDPTVADEERTG